ncbi:MAG: S-layer homology domain-containing protein [Clostridia bacterium]
MLKNVQALSVQAIKKGVAGALLVGALAAPVQGMAANALPFSDIANNSEKAAILKLNYAGVLKGYTDGTFKPDKEVTRAEFAKIAVLAMGYTEEQAKLVQGETIFKDLPANHWASGYINLAVSQGIIKGYPDGTFKPNNTVKVAEALTVYVQGLKINVKPSATSQWYTPYLLEANKVDLYDAKEAPTANAKRDVISKFTDRYMETPVYTNGAYYDKDGNADGTNHKLVVVKGAVASYDKKAQKLKLVGQNQEIAFTDNAQLFGNLIVGAEVEYIAKNGKIAFLNVVTADASIVEGIVKSGLNFTTAVGDEKKFKAIVNGKEVVLEVGTGVTVSSSQIGQKFVAVVDEDGKVTSLSISKNATKGIVQLTSSVSGTNAKKQIKLDGTVYDLTTNAAVTGKAHPLADEAKASFADIAKGDLVELTLDINGKVSAVTFTKLTATEEIEIDTDRNTIVLGDSEYEVHEDTELFVNEKEVSELDRLKDGQLAVLTFDEDGNLTKVEQGTGIAANKLVDKTTAYVAGNPPTPATIKVDGKTYDLLPTAKLTLDGKSVSATTIQANQLNDYRIVSWKYNLGTNDIVELTAEKQTVTGYVKKKTDSTVTVNGEVYELVDGVTIDKDAASNDKEYTLILNNKGQVKAITGAEKTVTGVVESVEVIEEGGTVKSAEITIDGKTYTVVDADALDNVKQFELVTLTLDRDGDGKAAVTQGKQAQTDVEFKGIESRVNGDRYVYYTDESTNLKLTKDAKVLYYDGSEMDETDVKKTDRIDLWTNDEGKVYVIVVAKR